jgi:hypothetical protein
MCHILRQTAALSPRCSLKTDRRAAASSVEEWNGWRLHQGASSADQDDDTEMGGMKWDEASKVSCTCGVVGLERTGGGGCLWFFSNISV